MKRFLLLLLVMLTTSCATQNSSVSLHLWGGRSQNGEMGNMEAPSNVHDLIGDIPISIPMGQQEIPSFGGGEETHTSPAPLVASSPPGSYPDALPDVVTSSPPPPPPEEGSLDRYAGEYPEDWVIVQDGPVAFSRAGYPVPTSRFRGRENETYIKPSADKILMPWDFVKYGVRWYIMASDGEVALQNTTRFEGLSTSEALPNDGRVHLFRSGLSRLSGRLMMEDIDGGLWASQEMNFGIQDSNWSFDELLLDESVPASSVEEESGLSAMGGEVHIGPKLGHIYKVDYNPGGPGGLPVTSIRSRDQGNASVSVAPAFAGKWFYQITDQPGFGHGRRVYWGYFNDYKLYRVRMHIAIASGGFEDSIFSRSRWLKKTEANGYEIWELKFG